MHPIWLSSVILAVALAPWAGCPGNAAPGASEPVSHGQPCGGLAGIPCQAGLSCVDDPRDDCDPQHGGADCSGVCVQAGEDPCDAFGRSYTSRDPSSCASIRISCDTESAPFSDACGCGCEPR